MRSLDLAVILLYLVGITWFGARFRRTQKTLKDYFLGGRTAPWWAIALSIVSAETSTLTIIGTPTLAFAGTVPRDQLAPLIVTQWLLKSGYETIATPLTYAVVSFLKRAEHEDYYDYHTDFNPLKLEVG